MRTSKKRNLIIALLCLRVRLGTLRTRIVEGWIRAYESTLFFLLLLASLVWHDRVHFFKILVSVCRLDLSTEKVTYLGQHENTVSAMNYAREQSAFFHFISTFSFLFRGSVR